MECPHIVEINRDEFYERISKKIEANRAPHAGTIELTFRCNLNCVHCYVSSLEPSGEELVYEDICDILDTAVGQGFLSLLITGGEPLIRPDFLDIYTYAKKNGLIITLFTNGTLITEEIADYLQEWPPYAVEITLHGIKEETYEKITGVKGSFEKCMKGIQLLLERNIPLNLKTMVMKQNKNELDEIKKYVKELGLDYRFDAFIHAGLGGNKNPCRVRLSPEELVQLDIEDEEKSQAWIEFCQEHWGPLSSGKLYNCGAGWNSFHIDPLGRMSVCGSARFPYYDLRQGSFEEGYYDFFPKILSQKLKSTQYKCDQCEMRLLCDQCPGLAQLETNDSEKPVEYICRIAHLRAKAFKKEVKKIGQNQKAV